MRASAAEQIKRDIPGYYVYIAAQGFCVASIGPRLNPFVVVLELPRTFQTNKITSA
jgi:hypothetical protein